MSNTEFKSKNEQIWPISLFVYYNSSDHWAKIFLYLSFLWSTNEKFVIWVFLKRKIVPSLCALFLEKTTRSDICWPRAAGVVRRPKKNFSWKTQLDSSHVKKKICRKIPLFRTKIALGKVGPDLIFHGFEVACPYSFSSPCCDISVVPLPLPCGAYSYSNLLSYTSCRNEKKNNEYMNSV